ncbi:MAG: rhodanese-like domain-containing protein [Cytophagales bacterium]|nr:rhodanese-like domain-containing protein [Cytophagales bacterium]
MFGLFKRKKDTYQNIGLEAFNAMRQQKDTIVIDVRNPKEIASGAVPGHLAINISESDFREKVAKLDQSKTYLIYCRSGMRSAKACRIMSGMGFQSLYNFKGGIIEWNAGQ